MTVSCGFLCLVLSQWIFQLKVAGFMKTKKDCHWWFLQLQNWNEYFWIYQQFWWFLIGVVYSAKNVFTNEMIKSVITYIDETNKSLIVLINLREEKPSNALTYTKVVYQLVIKQGHYISSQSLRTSYLHIFIFPYYSHMIIIQWVLRKYLLNLNIPVLFQLFNLFRPNAAGVR